MQETKQIQAIPYQASQPFNREFQGRVLGSLSFAFSNVITTGAAGLASFFTDPMWKLLGTLDVVQNETSLIRAPAQALYWLSALLDSEPGPYSSPTIGASTTGLQFGGFALDFQKMVGPLGMIDARFSKLFVRGTFQPVTAVSNTANAVASIAGTLRPSGRTTDRVPDVAADAAYLRPNFYTLDVDISVSSSNLIQTVRFEQDMILPGIMLLVKDDSAGGSTVQVDPQASRVNGLLKAVKVDLQSQDYNGEILRATWQELRNASWRGTAYSNATGQPLGVKPDGVVWLPFIDERNRPFNGAMMFRRGDALTFTFDTSGTAEEPFTNVAPAANDLLTLLIPGFAPTNATQEATSVGNAASLRKGVRNAPPGANVRQRLQIGGVI